MSLTNPNKSNRLVARSQKVFEREGCAGCHTPPLYTNNRLVPVDGFEVPAEHRQMYVPTGFKGAGVTARAVKGHRFGLGLSPTDRQALISFLKTL